MIYGDASEPSPPSNSILGVLSRLFNSSDNFMGCSSVDSWLKMGNEYSLLGIVQILVKSHPNCKYTVCSINSCIFLVVPSFSIVLFSGMILVPSLISLVSFRAILFSIVPVVFFFTNLPIICPMEFSVLELLICRRGLTATQFLRVIWAALSTEGPPIVPTIPPTQSAFSEMILAVV